MNLESDVEVNRRGALAVIRANLQEKQRLRRRGKSLEAASDRLEELRNLSQLQALLY